MLIRLPPEQIMAHWPAIKECIACALPPHIRDNDESLLAVQERLLTGIIECWVACENKSGIPLYGVVTTRIIREEISGIKQFLIFTVTIVDRHEEYIWMEGLETLKQYAKAKGCSVIIAYSQVPQMVRIASQLGFDTKTHLLIMDV